MCNSGGFLFSISEVSLVRPETSRGTSPPWTSIFDDWSTPFPRLKNFQADSWGEKPLVSIAINPRFHRKNRSDPSYAAIRLQYPSFCFSGAWFRCYDNLTRGLAFKNNLSTPWPFITELTTQYLHCHRCRCISSATTSQKFVAWSHLCPN